MDGRPSRRNKAALSNSSGILCLHVRVWIPWAHFRSRLPGPKEQFV